MERGYDRGMGVGSGPDLLRSFGSLVEHDCLIFRSSICSAAYDGSYAGSNASKYKQPRHTGNVRSIFNKSSYEKGPDSKSGPKRSPNPDSVTQAILTSGLQWSECPLSE